MTRKIAYAIVALFIAGGALLADDSYNLEFVFDKGSQWYHDIKIGLFTIKGIPQTVIWVEKEDGTFIKTLYVSKKASAWYKNKRKDRADTLPVWQSKESGNVDTVTGASVEKEPSLHKKIASSSKRLVVFVEINNSFDYNEYYSKDGKNSTQNSGVNGQPSLVYKAIVDSSKKGNYELELLGHGGVGAAAGTLQRDLSTITTARNIVNQIIVKLK